MGSGVGEGVLALLFEARWKGAMGRALWDSRGGRFLTTAGWGEKIL